MFSPIWSTQAEFRHYRQHCPDVPVGTLAGWALDTAPLYFHENRIAFILWVKRTQV